MEQSMFMLLATAVLGGFAIFFAIIGVATDGWPGGWSGVWPGGANKIRLFSWGNQGGYNYTAAGVLLIISIVIMAIAIVLTIMFLLQFINRSAHRIKGVVLVLFILAGIFIVAAYSRAIHIEFYSYHLAATAGTLAFLSMIFFTYWIGHTSVTLSP